uniref:Uncharacterized protein n=1 Tax=Aegilops tauschii TaxID=37682 RepID=N1QSM3_AEGTA
MIVTFFGCSHRLTASILCVLHSFKQELNEWEEEKLVGLRLCEAEADGEAVDDEPHEIAEASTPPPASANTIFACRVDVLPIEIQRGGVYPG